MVEGRSKAVFKDWLAGRPEPWRANIEIVAMAGFSGFKTAAAEEIPEATAVMNTPSASSALPPTPWTAAAGRIQQQLHGHGGRSGDPLHSTRRTLSTGDGLLTDKQRTRLHALFAVPEHVEVEATWGIDRRRIAACRDHDRTRGRAAMTALIDAVGAGVPATLVELRWLGRTLKQPAADISADFDRPHTSNGPTEAINGPLEHLRGSALGFRNLTNYLARSLLESGGFRPRLLRPRSGGPL